MLQVYELFKDAGPVWDGQHQAMPSKPHVCRRDSGRKHWRTLVANAGNPFHGNHGSQILRWPIGRAEVTKK